MEGHLPLPPPGQRVEPRILKYAWLISDHLAKQYNTTTPRGKQYTEHTHSSHRKSYNYLRHG